MGKRFILWVLSYAWLALLAGLGLLGMAGYSTYSASHGGMIPEEAALTSASGHITEDREITVERKRRYGGKTAKKYYELDLQPASGDKIKLRVDFDVPRATVETAVDGDVAVRYDPGDHNNTYVIQQDGEDLVSYADMARLAQKNADHDKEIFASPGMMGFAVLLALLGGGGLWWRRKLLAPAPAEPAQAKPLAPGEQPH
ncbi:MAG: hypothetical protein FWG56_00115 [Desulfovibrionaceae bacterium]|nr:hypothetical protein [Desulfovibrionaceae bacterium]